MPIDLTIPHAVLLSDPSGVRVAAKSDDFPFTWEEQAVRLAEAFGPRPAGVAVPAALAVLPFGTRHTAVVRFADHGSGLAFRLLVLNRKLYEAISDPFAADEKFPPNWSARGPLPQLSWTPDPPPPRTVAEVADLLKGDGPTLLGGAQALLDGVKVAVPRPAPDDALIRAAWKLLPYRERCELSFTTFAFKLDDRFNYCVLPTPPDPLPFGWVGEAKVGDHPPGRYELAVQIAAESGNQAELDRLFARRSSKDTLRMALVLVGLALLALVVTKLLW